VSRGDVFCGKCGSSLADGTAPSKEHDTQPTGPSPLLSSFADGRYQIKESIGEGGTKRVYLAHDGVLDRDVALGLIRTEGLDEDNRLRVTREAQAMGRLGSHQNIVVVHDFGDEDGQPYIVQELMQGDVAGLIEEAEDHRLPIEQAIDIATSVCQGLEFTHGKGIIHRDLKPGNVFITAGGVFKIGDFGLALADDHTRLTQTDGVLGTFLYSSPEQASGSEVTVRSDLYSLGAMVYEMVTGRPPFVGDDSVSIIGQHLNNPPVNPSFHRPDIPRALEAIILRLLEKGPQKRPASASDVLNALKAVETGEAPAAPETEAPDDISPIYRRVFVGRESELKQLKTAFDDACSGNGSLAMVVGEPGIGKTALCEELKTYVGIRGGQTLVGHCYEEGSLSLPYLAFVEAMRGYVLERDPDDLREVLGTGAAHVGRIVSEIRDRLQIELPEPVSPEEERYRLMQSVSEFLSHGANIQPMLIVLEDLHDADQGTLDMLAFVSRQLSGSRILIVGNYRDVEVDRAHPLSRALAELRRATNYNRVQLRGLNADEVQRMLTAIAGQDMPWGIAEDVFRSTEGNPLFVQEVMRHLVEDGQIRREEGRWLGFRQSEVAMRIPEGLREVIGKRLSALSPETNRVLSIAAVIGREFRFRILQQVSESSEEELYGALEQAQNAVIIEARTAIGAIVRYRFTHAFFRQTLYEEIIAPRRIRMHQQVARALEELYANRLEEHAAELAEHFSHSSDEEDLAKAIGYGEMAAERAASVYDFGEAVRSMERALEIQEVLGPQDRARRCDLLLALCRALIAAGDPRRVLDVEAPIAWSLAESLDDHTRASLVCGIALLAGYIYGGGWLVLDSAEAIEWAGRADRYAGPDTVERAMAEMSLGQIMCVKGRYNEGIPLLRRALDLAQRLDDAGVYSICAGVWMNYAWAPQHADSQLSLAEGAIGQSPERGDLWWPSSIFLASGRRGRAEELWQGIRSRGKRTGQAYDLILSAVTDILQAALDGRLEDAVACGDRLLALGRDLGLDEFAYVMFAVTCPRSLCHLGEAGNGLPSWVDSIGTLGHVIMTCFYQAHLGRDREVAERLERSVLSQANISPDEDERPMWIQTVFLEAAVLVEHHEAADLLLRRLADCRYRTTGHFYTTCISRHLGASAALLNRPGDARSHYQNALEAATEMRFRPELALTRFQLAELLLEHYPDEGTEALEHLDFALEEFKEMKMKPYIEKAQALNDGL